MRLNKQGFAISSVIYIILILFLVLIFGILSILGSRKLIFDKMKNDVMDKLNGDYVEKDPEPEKEPNLIQTLLEQYNELNTVGLLKDETGYYFKGSKTQVKNNFVWFGGHLWRVLSINDDNTLTMITQQPLTAINAGSIWGDEEHYKTSLIHTWLNDVFLNSISDVDKAKMRDNTFNVGVITDNVSSITTIGKVGLLDEIQYAKAGNGITGLSSFLDIKNNFWLGTRTSGGDLNHVLYNGELTHYLPTTEHHGIRPVIRISNLLITDTGEGTLENPYREKQITTSTSNIKVGEYVSVPTTGNDCGEDNRCLFRVVSKDNNSIKVILNGFLPAKSEFDINGNTTYTSDNTVNTILITFANTINSRYRYTGNDKSFGIGSYSTFTNYIEVQENRYTGNVGLPVVGEMFSGNDIEGTNNSYKNFVNINTIENPTLSGAFWFMNAYDSTSMDCINVYGTVKNFSVSSKMGVRPVLFLNNNLTFTNGDGTAENPFILE